MTTTQVQFRRGTSSQVAAFAGAQGEIVIDTTNNRVVVQDGISQGGWPHARMLDVHGFRNKFRNAAMGVAYHNGQSGSVSASSTAYSLDGWMISAIGAAAAWQRVYSINLAGNALRISTSSGLTAVTLQQRIESYLAAQLLQSNLTTSPIIVQFTIYNGTSASITPQLATQTPNARDNYAATTADLAALNLQTIAAGAVGTVACIFTPASAANLTLGYQVQLLFGSALNGSSGYVDIAGADIRGAFGMATGLCPAPPGPELRPLGVEFTINGRYFCSSFPDGTAPQAALGANTGEYIYAALLAGANVLRPQYYQFPCEMRVNPTFTTYNPVNNNNQCYNQDQAADCTSTNPQVKPKGFDMITMGPSSTTVGNKISWHWTASAAL